MGLNKLCETWEESFLGHFYGIAVFYARILRETLLE